MPWAVAAAGITGAASLGSAAMQSGAAGKAGAQSQRNVQLMLPQMQQNDVAAGQRYNDYYDNALGWYRPYITAGNQALVQQQDLLGLNGQAAADAARATFQTSPGYQWSVDQAERAVDAGAAARGMLRSGATLKAEQDRAAQLANQEFGNYYNRLSGLVGQGQYGTTGLSAADQFKVSGLTTADNNLIAGMQGNIQGQNAALVNTANAQNSILGNATSGLSNTVNSLFSNKDFRNWASGMFGGGGSTFSPSSTGTYGGQPVYTGPTNVDAPATYNF